MKQYKLILLFFIILLGLTIFIQDFHTNTIPQENTLVISVCTGDMRTLETGISAYAGYKQVPLILSDKTLPIQLKKWLPGYVKENNITQIIIAGQISIEEKWELLKMGVNIKQLPGNNIPEILTSLAENTQDKNNDTIILTASDPLAGYYGAYTKTPVFTTAENATYNSAKKLDEQYKQYITKHNIKHITIIGSIPESIKEELKTLNIEIEEINGENSIILSNNVNQKLREKGLLNNTNTTYYGFYGELPTMIPSIISSNSMLIEDSSNTQNILPTIKENNINTVYLTRNTETDYIQMEETDYISSKTIKQLQENNIAVKYMTKGRTLDEATGLYDTKIMTAETFENNTHNNIEENKNNIKIKTKPPQLAILDFKNITDSNNVTAQITQKNGIEYNVKWDTIHPYTWTKNDENNYYATSNGEYEYYWTQKDDTWQVTYCHNKTPYYNITWKQNNDNSWTEIHENNNYTWDYDGQKYYCYNNEKQVIYTITINK